MKIAVWGLGYVGTVSAACFAKLGHDVIGMDVSQPKVDALNAGTCAVVEPGLAEIVAEVVASGRLRATTNGSSHVADTDVSLICVGTPSNANGSANLDYLHKVSCDIGESLRTSADDHYHVVVVRSTVNPGVMTELIIPTLEAASGKRAGADFGVAVNPEFLREATAVKDFFEPPYTIIGEYNARAGDILTELYRDIDAPVHRVKMDEASLLKVVNNAFHALKVGFANEIGRIAASLKLDSHTIMNLVCADTKLNISPAYLRPGFAFGGSCLPKDLRSLTYNAERMGVKVPILDAILPSNEHQIDAARLRIHELDAKRVAVLGLSFKVGTDDLRESPVLQLVRELWRDGLDITVYDPNVELDRMLGSNRNYLERELPQIKQILCPDLDTVLANRDLVIITQKRPEFVNMLANLNHNTAVLDLVRLGHDHASNTNIRYEGLSW